MIEYCVDYNLITACIPQLGWLDDFKEFSADTSAHGVKYVFHGDHKVIKMLFLVIWFASIGYAVYVIAISAISFIGKPTGQCICLIVICAISQIFVQSCKFYRNFCDILKD